MNLTIAKKLSLLVTAVVLVMLGILVYTVNSEYDSILTQQELKSMGENTGKEAAKILTTIERMKEDAIFLSDTPPIRGIIRAHNNSGIDPLDGSSETLWQDQLAIIFKSFLTAKPQYLKVRFIGIQDNGKEIVKIDKISKQGIFNTNINMQSKSHRDYYKKGVLLNNNEVYISNLTYNYENGKISLPHTLVIRAATPVFTPKGNMYGLVVLTLDVNYMFSEFLSLKHDSGNEYANYILNYRSEYLGGKTENKGLLFSVSEFSTTDEVNNKWQKFYSSSNETDFVTELVRADTNAALYVKKLFLDAKDKSRFLVLVEEKPYSQVVSKASHVKLKSMIIAILLFFPALLITFSFSNLLMRPLKEITYAISNFKKNKNTFDFDIYGDDEIGALAQAFHETANDLDMAQEQLLQSEKMASIGQLAAGVAHEINNPVGFIGSNINTLKEYIDDLFSLISEYEKHDDYLKNNKDSFDSIKNIKKEIDLDFLKLDLGKLLKESSDGVKRVKDIVQDLKDFSHVDEMEWHLANIHEGLSSTLNIVHNEIKYKADVETHYGNLPEIECIGSQLNQVFMNLLVNAAHSIEGHGTITIETGMTDDDWIWISISDTGSGIPQSKIKNIFDPFYTTKPVGQGTGLGLSLSYGIIDKHSGRIEVESEEGIGTKFTIWLPTKQKQDNNHLAA